MTTLSSFFKGSDTRFGVFYPSHYLIALFPDVKVAERAERKLLSCGFKNDNVVAVSGEELLHYAEDSIREHGVWALLMQELSRMFATEEVYADQDLDLAAHGAALLAVYCPSGTAKNKAWALLEPLGPLAARYYAFSGVEHLTGEYRP